MEADEVLSWLRQLGFGQPAGKSAPRSASSARPVLTRQGIRPFLTEETRPFWQSVVQQFKREAQASAPASNKEQEEEDVQAQLQEQQARNARLKELLRTQQERIASRAAEVTTAEAQVARMQQQLEGSQAQLLMLTAAQERHAQLLPLLEQHAASLQQLSQLARARAAAAKPSPPLVALLEKLCSELQQGVMAQSDVWLAMQPDDELDGPPTASTFASMALGGGAAAAAGSTFSHRRQHSLGSRTSPSPPSSSSVQHQHQQPILSMSRSAQHLEASLMQLMGMAPSTLLALITEMVHKGTRSLQQGGAKSSQQGRGQQQQQQALAGSSASAVLLRQRHQAHVDKFVSTEEKLLTIEQAERELQRAREAASGVLQWPYNQHKLQEARLSAELGALRQELARLVRECEERQDAERAVSQLFQRNKAAQRHENKLNALVNRLMFERREVVARWTQESGVQEAWAQQHFPAACQTLSNYARSSGDVLSRECESASRVQLLSLPAHAVQPAHLAQHVPHLAGSAPARKAASLDTPTLQLQWQSLPIAVGLSPLATPALPNTTPGRVPIAKVGAGAASHASSQLANVLRVACQLDVLAPLRCPGSLLCGISDQQSRLRTQRAWLGVAQQWLEAGVRKVKLQHEQGQQAEKALAAARAQDKASRCVALRANMAKARHVLAHIRDKIVHDLDDLKNLPAVQLLPDAQFSGLNASEWLTAIQELHAAIEDAEQRAGTKQQAR